MKEAVGTSLLIIACNSVAGFLGYLGQVPLDWELMGLFIMAASVGILAGAYLAQYVKAQQLQRAFGYLLIAVAAFILFQNRQVFTSEQNQTELSRWTKENRTLLSFLNTPQTLRNDK